MPLPPAPRWGGGREGPPRAGAASPSMAEESVAAPGVPHAEPWGRALIPHLFRSL